MYIPTYVYTYVYQHGRTYFILKVITRVNASSDCMVYALLAVVDSKSKIGSTNVSSTIVKKKT